MNLPHFSKRLEKPPHVGIGQSQQFTELPYFRRAKPLKSCLGAEISVANFFRPGWLVSTCETRSWDPSTFQNDHPRSNEPLQKLIESCGRQTRLNFKTQLLEANTDQIRIFTMKSFKRLKQQRLQTGCHRPRKGEHPIARRPATPTKNPDERVDFGVGPGPDPGQTPKDRRNAAIFLRSPANACCAENAER